MSETRYDVADGVAHLVFDRPEQRNALTFAMYDRLREVCEAVADDRSIRALILSGAGARAFAAGTDMTQFRAFATPEDAWAYERRIESVLGALERCPVPTIAAITGACTGGGAGIAASCDLRVTDPALKFGFPIARTLGNCLSASNLARLSALIGAGRVREILFTARLIGAEEAARIGLVTEIADDPLARAREIAEQMKGHAPLTLRATKEALRRLKETQVDDRDLIALCYTSADFKEGIEAFLGKRTPEWRGE